MIIIYSQRFCLGNFLNTSEHRWGVIKPMRVVLCSLRPGNVTHKKVKSSYNVLEIQGFVGFFYPKSPQTCRDLSTNLWWFILFFFFFFLSSSAGASRSSAAASSSLLKFAPTKLFAAAIYYSVTPAAAERANTRKLPAAKSASCIHLQHPRRASVDSKPQSGITKNIYTHRLIVGLQSRAAIGSVHGVTTDG